MSTFLQRKVKRIVKDIEMQDKHVAYLDRYIEDLYKKISIAKREQKRSHEIGNRLMTEMAVNQSKMSRKEMLGKS